MAECCIAFGVELHEVLGKRKTRADIDVTRARKAIAWALRVRFEGISYPMIARMMRRDHSTVMWSVEAFQSALAANEPWALDLSGRVFGTAHPPMAGLESPLDSLRRCAGLDLSTAVDMPIESLSAMGAAE